MQLFPAETLTALEKYLDSKPDKMEQLLSSPVAPRLFTSSQTEHFDPNVMESYHTTESNGINLSTDSELNDSKHSGLIGTSNPAREHVELQLTSDRPGVGVPQSTKDPYPPS